MLKNKFNMDKRSYRMYGLVPYNLSPIQQGIQFGHAVVEYGLHNYTDDDYQEWANNHKTFIILNGGTTNLGYQHNNKGTLNQYLDELVIEGIKVSTFYEPDLGDQLTAIVFLVDDRVWDREKYPDFVPDWESHNDEKILGGVDVETQYDNWVRKFSKDEEEQRKIVFLRDYLKQFRLA